MPQTDEASPTQRQQCYKGKTLSKKTLHSIRAQVAEQIETQLEGLLLTREQHKGEDSLLRRLLTL